MGMDYSGKEETKKNYGNIFLAIITMIMVLAVLKALKDIMIPLVLAMIFFFIFSPLTERLDRWHVPHFISVVVCFVLTMMLMFVAGILFYKTISMLIVAIPHYNERLVSLDHELSLFVARYPHFDIPEDTSIVAILPVNWRSLAIDTLTTLAGSIINVVKVSVMILLYELFLLMERPVFVPKIRAAFTNNGAMIAMMSERISKQVSKFLLLKALISFFTGLMFYVAALACGMEVPLMYGVLAFAFNFIPSIGSIIVTILTIVMGILQFAPHWSPIIFIIVMTIMTEMVLGNIIDPKLQGGQLNISPFAILVGLAIWGYIWGIVGMFLAVPIISCIEIVCANVKPLRPIALLLSGGRSLLRQSESAQRRQERKEKKQQKSKKNAPKRVVDIVLPDKFPGGEAKKSVE